MVAALCFALNMTWTTAVDQTASLLSGLPFNLNHLGPTRVSGFGLI